MERRLERVRHAACGLGRRLVAACCGGYELLLQRLDMTLELHDDIILTSSLQSVKCS